MVFTVDWFTGYIPAWKSVFGATKVPENVLEIGSFEGRSTCWLLENTQAHVTCVDTWDGSDEHGDELKNGLFDRFQDSIKDYKDRVTICRGFSGEVLRTFTCEPTFDFIYIDTTHQYDQTVLELELAYKKIKNNGIVAGHDYHPQMFGEVVNAVHFFSDKYKLPFTLTTDDVLNTYIFLIQKP